MGTAWLTAAEVVDMLRVTRQLVVEWTRTGKLPAYRFDSVLRYRAEDVEAMATLVAGAELQDPALLSLALADSTDPDTPADHKGQGKGGRPNPPAWQMVKEATATLPPPFRNVEIRDWILARYPSANPGTIDCQIAACTVNQDSRVQWPENQRPRRCTSARLDLLYRTGRGLRELYDPERHGEWTIELATDGKLSIRGK
jgi:hypothetical protein